MDVRDRKRWKHGQKHLASLSVVCCITEAAVVLAGGKRMSGGKERELGVRVT